MTYSLKTLTLISAMLAGTILHSTRADAETLRDVTVAGGCFWCVESDFERVGGVKEAVSGYTGGQTANPTYREVASKRTGHYEAVRISYDADRVSARQLYDMFFRSIDPTDAGGQFCDRGSPYKTAIFVTPDQRADAEAAKSAAEKALGQKIVTEILPLGVFTEAEAYHQDYYKSTERVVTRRGVKTKADAYKFYRSACGRDQGVKRLWGDAAPFVQH